MRVEVFDAIAPSRALSFENDNQSLAAIVDGAGSWGNGREAADLSRAALGNLWAGVAEWSSAQLVRDITETALQMPDKLRDAEFGWSFSLTALLCTDDAIECVAAGFYRVDIVGSGPIRNLFRPTMLVDDLVAKGIITPETIASFPHREVCIGPFVGDNARVALTTVSYTLAPAEILLVTHAARHNRALHPGSALPSSAKALAALAAPDSYPSPVIFVEHVGDAGAEKSS